MYYCNNIRMQGKRLFMGLNIESQSYTERGGFTCRLLFLVMVGDYIQVLFAADSIKVKLNEDISGIH